MKIKNALDFAAEQLTESDSPVLDARLLLAHVLDVNHSYFVAHAEERLPTEPLQSFLTLVARAEKREPIPYIIGRIPFQHVTLAVTPDVLIPRPETELLVEKAIAWARRNAAKTAVDVGTGSGCIAISMAKALPELHVSATDISAQSLRVARGNALENGVTIAFEHGSLLEPLTHNVDLIVANLPYITDAEWAQLDQGVKLYEPSHALKGGVDGLDLVRSLLQQAQVRLNRQGAIFLEIGWQQGAATVELAREHFPAATIACWQDYAGKDRIVHVELG